jgi:hypothetical protein
LGLHYGQLIYFATHKQGVYPFSRPAIAIASFFGFAYDPARAFPRDSGRGDLSRMTMTPPALFGPLCFVKEDEHELAKEPYDHRRIGSARIRRVCIVAAE